MGYALSRTIERDFGEAVEAIRVALAMEGFGVLTEIDMKATLKAKIDAEIEPQVILGACRPPLAFAALQAEPSVGLLLPCNVVVRSIGHGRVVVEALDPEIMVELTGNPALAEVAAEAGRRLSAALGSLTSAADEAAAQS